MRYLRCLFCICWALFIAPALASLPEPILKPSPPSEYTVQDEDTLWAVASEFLENPWAWPSLWTGREGEGSTLFPGDKILLQQGDAGFALKIQRKKKDETKEGLVQRADGTLAFKPRMRFEQPTLQIPTIPSEDIQPFLDRSRILTQSELNATPSILAYADGHLIGGAGYSVYVEFPKDHKQKAGEYIVVHPDGAIVDPMTNKALGYSAKYVGKVRLEEDSKTPKYRILEAKQEILRGDRLVPVTDRDLNVNLIPFVSDKHVDEIIVATNASEMQLTSHHVITITGGDNRGFREGQVLRVVETEAVHGSSARPESLTVKETKGRLMLFKVFRNLSMGLILDAKKPIYLKDRVTNL